MIVRSRFWTGVQWFLLCFMLPVSYGAFYLGITLPIVTIESSLGPDGAPLSITRSTMQSIRHLFSEQFYLPGTLILVFSVIVPVAKFITVLTVLLSSPAKASRLSYHLRVFAKYQLLDIFVALLMVAFLNQDVLSTKLEPGFVWYSIFCIMSVISAQLLYLLMHDPPVKELGQKIASAFSEQHMLLATEPSGQLDSEKNSLIPTLFRLLAFSGWLIGIAWSVEHSVLVVKIAFEGSLVLSQSSLSLRGIYKAVEAFAVIPGSSADLSSQALAGFLLVTVLLIPFMVATLLILTPSKSRKFEFLCDWAMTDVLALALFTTLVSLNSFGVLLSEAPDGKLSGFYFVLMAGLACLDLCMQTHATAVGEEAKEVMEEVLRIGRPHLESSADTPLLRPRYFSIDSDTFESEAQAVTDMMLSMSRPSLMKEAGKRMTGGVLVMKLVSWGVFFIVWFLRSKAQQMDLSTINAQIRSHIPAISEAMRSSLPESMGNCTAGAPIPCQGGNQSLFYERTALYEVEARWVAGLKSTSLHNIFLSVPTESVFAVAIDGEFGSLPLSLYIAQCSTPDVWITGKCDKLWDNTEACCGTRKKFSIVVLSECYPEFPFVRNIKVHSILVDPMQVEESVMGIVKVNLKDLTDSVQTTLKGELTPYLNEKKFIPWGDKNLTLSDLINKILLLNAGDHFSCPQPLHGFFDPDRRHKHI